MFAAFFRIIFNKECFTSFNQKFFCKYNFAQLDNFDYLIHFASIGELNSINYLIENLSGKKILLTCSTLSSYNLAKKRYQKYSVIYLPLDFRWNINKFLHHVKIKKIIWIDSEIWPNWLINFKQKKNKKYIN